MSKLLAIAVLGLLFFSKAYSHSGRTGPSGCHMNYSTGTQHCHKTKTYYTLPWKWQRKELLKE